MKGNRKHVINPIAIDTYALLAWIMKEPNCEVYRNFFSSENWRRFITPITLFELKLSMLKNEKKQDEQVAILAYVKTICEVAGVSEAISVHAAELKHKYKSSGANLSMADCIGVSLAESLNAPLLSGEKGLYAVKEVQVLPRK